jgi:cysteine-rich repeat protein
MRHGQPQHLRTPHLRSFRNRIARDSKGSDTLEVEVASLHGWGCVATGLALACGPADTFNCSSDAQCVQGSESGFCEATGYCSFPDDACDSGRRYGALAGGGLAGTCVGEAGTDASSVGTGPEPSSSASSPSSSTPDPSTSSAESTSEVGPSSTDDPPLPFCGDGDLDPGEACDDGNDDPADGCNEACVASGTVLCSHLSDDLPGNSYGMGIAWAGDGFVITGWAQSMTQGDDLVLRRYDADCEPQWTTIYDDLAHERGHGVAIGSDDRIWVAGMQTTLLETTQRLVGLFDAMGEPITVDLRAPGAALAIAPVMGLGVVVAGSAGEGVFEAVSWVGNYDEAGGFAGEILSASMEADRARALAIDGIDLYVTGNRGMQVNNIGDLVIDSVSPRAFTEIVRVMPPYELAEGQAIAIGSGGDLFVGGYLEQVEVELGLSARDAYVARYTASGELVWSDTYGTDATAYSDEFEAIAIAPDDDVVLAGFVNGGTALDSHLWVRRYTADGDMLWETVIDHAGRADIVRGLVIGPEGQLAVVAEVQDADGISHAWVGVLTP